MFGEWRRVGSLGFSPGLRVSGLAKGWEFRVLPTVERLGFESGLGVKGKSEEATLASAPVFAKTAFNATRQTTKHSFYKVQRFYIESQALPTGQIAAQQLLKNSRIVQCFCRFDFCDPAMFTPANPEDRDLSSARQK